jgi:hypothetical protein
MKGNRRSFDFLASPFRLARSLRMTIPLRCEHQEHDSRGYVCLSTQARWSGSVALVGLGNADGSHAGGGCALNTHVGVFKDEAVFGGDVEAGGGGEESIGSWLGARVVFGADKDRKAVEKTDSCERFDDRFAGAAGDDGKWNAAVLGVDVLEDFWNGLEIGEKGK